MNTAWSFYSSVSILWKQKFYQVQSWQGDNVLFFFYLAFTFCLFCMVIWFFSPATTANDLRLWRIFYPRFYPLQLFSYLNSWQRASISLFNVECHTRNYWYHFYNVFGMTMSLTGDWTRDLPHSMPALYH